MLNILLLFLLISCVEEHKYCGIVVEKYRTSGGYKTNPQSHVVFYCDSLKKNIDVNCTNNSYANAEIGKEICFELDDYDVDKK